MINNPTAEGKRTEAKIPGELVEAGKSVLISPGNGQLSGVRWARDFELTPERATLLSIRPD